jgi:hypothetical protein
MMVEVEVVLVEEEEVAAGREDVESDLPESSVWGTVS